jgi:hypothetical protein
MMSALGHFVKAKNALARAAFDDPNAPDINDLITAFKDATERANKEIMARAPKNRRGARFAGNFLRREQIDGIDTDLPKKDGIPRKTEDYIHGDNANGPALHLAEILAARTLKKRRRRSSTTDEEDEEDEEEN